MTVNFTPAKVLLATDGSEETVVAARAAAEISRRSGAELYVVYAWHEALGAYPHRNASLDQELRAQHELDEQVGEIRASGSPVTRSYLRRGPAVQAILELAEELRAGLIVAGSRGLGRVGRMMNGSVSEGLVHGADRPVLVVRGGEEAWPPQKILVGEDPPGAAGEAGEFAAALGGLYGSRLILVRDHRESVADTTAARLFLDQAASGASEFGEQASNGGVDKPGELGGRIAELLGRRPEVRAYSGRVTNSILRVDREESKPALIVVGSQEPVAGHHPPGHTLDKVLRAAHGPLLFHPRNLAAASHSKPRSPATINRTINTGGTR